MSAIWSRFWRDRAGRAELVGGQLAGILSRVLGGLDASTPTASYDDAVRELIAWTEIPPRPRFTSMRVDQWCERAGQLESSGDRLAAVLRGALSRFSGSVPVWLHADADQALAAHTANGHRRLGPLPAGSLYSPPEKVPFL